MTIRLLIVILIPFIWYVIGKFFYKKGIVTMVYPCTALYILTGFIFSLISFIMIAILSVVFDSIARWIIYG